MASYITNTLTDELFEEDTLAENVVMKTPKEKYEIRIAWRDVIVFAYLHLAALYGTYLLFTSAKLMIAASGSSTSLRTWV